MCLGFHAVRRHYRKKRLASTPPGFTREKLRLKELLLSLKIRITGVYSVDRRFYVPDGFKEAAHENTVCPKHGDNQ
jgi:hypothetical protein